MVTRGTVRLRGGEGLAKGRLGNHADCTPCFGTIALPEAAVVDDHAESDLRVSLSGLGPAKLAREDFARHLSRLLGGPLQ